MNNFLSDKTGYHSNGLKRFSIECRKTKVITTANQNEVTISQGANENFIIFNSFNMKPA